MAKVVTESFRVESTDEFVKSFADAAGNDYYIMGSSVTQDPEISNTQKSIREFQRKVVFGNKIDDSSVKYMFAKKPWVSGTIYDAFDDEQDMSTKNFYVTVLGGNGQINESNYNVFKCIRNNNGGPSTQTPSDIGAETNYEVTLGDGYVWKYMFDVPPAQYLLFGTSKFLPYVANQDIIDQSTQGISDVVIESVDEGGLAPYLVGSETNPSQAIVTAVSTPGDYVPGVEQTWELRLSCSRLVKSSVGAYQNMYFRVVDDEDIFDITDSRVPNDDDKSLIIQIKSDRNLISFSDKFCEIVPKVEISPPDGSTGASRAIAYGLVNSLGTLKNIAFISKGSGYTFATAELLQPPSANFETTDIRPVVTPKGGHGSNPVHELFMSRVATVTSFITDVNTSIPGTNSYTKVGLVKNPSFVDSDGNDIASLDDFDNRVKLVINTSQLLDSQADVGFYVEQTIGTQTVSGIIHEVKFVNNATEIYLVDTVGAYSGKFQPGQPFKIKLTATSPNTSFEGTINSIRQNTYVPYSGEVLHFVDFDPITRTLTSKEKIKLIFDF